MTITFEEIVSVFRKLAIYTPEAYRINAFTVIDDGTYFDSDELSRSYDDYLKGYYWSRNWELAGADPSTMRKEWPAFGVEHKVTVVDNGSRKEQTEEWWLVVGDVPNILAQESERNIFDVDRRVSDMLRYIIFKLSAFELATITIEGQTYTTWDTAARLYAQKDAGVIDNIVFHSIDFLNFVGSIAGKITPVRSGFASKARVASFKLEINTCMEAVPELDISYTPTKLTGITLC